MKSHWNLILKGGRLKHNSKTKTKRVAYNEKYIAYNEKYIAYNEKYKRKRRLYILL